MSRSRLIFFGIIGAALLLVAITVAIPKFSDTLNSGNATTAAINAATATAQYLKDNVTTIRISYGTEKERWFRDAITQFTAANPNIKVDLVGEGSMTAYQALSRVTDQTTANIPAVWSPASTIQVNLLNANNAVSRELATSCKRLVLSPLVIIGWDDRTAAFKKAYDSKGGVTFANLYDAVNPNGTIKGSWAKLGGDSAWGLIKLGHTDPAQSNSGVMMLVAMANNYYNRTAPIKTGDVTDQAFQDWLAVMEKAVAQPPLSSTGTFVNDVIVKGPSSYDFVVGYEALAIENFANAKGRQGQGLQIIYPPVNLYSDHPMCLIDHPSISKAQREAAKKLQDFLTGDDMQKLAVKYGFRPANPNIPIFGTGTDFDNADLKAAGLSTNVGQELQLPDGNTLTQLLVVYQRNSGR